MIEMKGKDTKMELIGKEGFTFTDGGVCAAKGFLANGLNCGLNSDQNKNDLCLIMSESECTNPGNQGTSCKDRRKGKGSDRELQKCQYL